MNLLKKVKHVTWKLLEIPKLSGVSHKRAIKALEKAGFRVVRQGKHVTMTNGERILIILRTNPINAFTMAGIVKDAGLTIEEFKKQI